MAASFLIRPASSALGDGERILGFTDSQLPWLAQHGAEGQWGSTPFSGNEKSRRKYRSKIERSQIADQEWNEDWMKVFIAEVDANTCGGDISEPTLLPVAAMILCGSSSDYTRSVIPAQDENDPFLYVSWVVSDRNVGHLSEGSGEVLLDHAKSVAVELGLSRLCLDCWNGNGRRLVKYYETKGFLVVGDFVDLDGWSGTVLEARI